MKPERIPIKGPVGKSTYGDDDVIAPQEKYGDEGSMSKDESLIPSNDGGLVFHETDGLKSDDGDHTPDNSFITHAPRIKKPDYGVSRGRG